jgi:membrane protein YdbS with pleckstrin-like domain
MVEGPHEQLSTRAVAYWRVSLLLRVVPVAAVVTVLALVLPWFPDVVRVLLIAGIWVAAVVEVVVLPPLRRRVWWFAIGDEEVDLHHGLLTVTRSVVPMVRVQHVDLHRNALADRFDLAEIELHTAAGSLTIPALDRDQAERIRRQVAVLARVPDEV